MPENTTKRDPMLHLLGAMSDGPSRYIEDMEAAGQRQIVNSTDLPTKLNGDTDADFEAVGFTFGEPHKHDPMFRWPLVMNDEDIVLDDEWLTREVAVETLAGIRDRYAKDAAEAERFAKQDGPERGAYWTERATEHRETAAKAEKLRAELAEAVA